MITFRGVCDGRDAGLGVRKHPTLRSGVFRIPLGQGFGGFQAELDEF